jgi:hypothetical protein
MTDQSIRAALLTLLGRSQRYRLANRLITFALSAASLYFSLLIALLAFALSLFLFHLIFYCALSLLPLFLILGQEHDRTRAVLRRIDDRCQTEAYLAAKSPEHRAFLEPRVQSLLDQRRREKILRFRLNPWNRYLALGAAAFFLAFQLLSLTTQNRLGTLSASGILARKAQREATALAGAKPQASAEAAPGESIAEEASESEPGSEAGGVAAGEGKRDTPEAGIGPEGGTAEPYTDTGPLANPSLQDTAGPGTEAERSPWTAIPKTEAGIGQALQGALEGSPDPSAQQGQVPAGAGDAGKAFLTSPLSEYGSVAERIQIEGGKRLTASSPTEPREQSDLQSLFADFPAVASPSPGFDSALERIQNRYMEMLDERY